ncbi:hypothetical protein [Ligilactobacillus acidipiscis]|uniref:hypothetical protein n=1 Tax=Ligilactobacillus acidipiscis TaxID=89059 RepID=UPI00024926CB|nr:hypothetical protein [Ligilactobacillus acidipiscis]
MGKLLKLVVSATRRHSHSRLKKDIEYYCNHYCESQVNVSQNVIIVKDGDLEQEIRYVSIKSQTLDGLAPNEFELDESVAMLSSIDDVKRILLQLRNGRIGVVSHERMINNGKVYQETSRC